MFDYTFPAVAQKVEGHEVAIAARETGRSYKSIATNPLDYKSSKPPSTVHKQQTSGYKPPVAGQSYK